MCIIVIISVLAFLRKRPVKIPLESSVNNVLRMLCHFLITSIHGTLTSNSLLRKRMMVNSPFLTYLSTTLRVIVFFQFFIKKIYTGLLTNFFSFTPSCYKIGLIRTLIDRFYKINNTSSGLQNDLNKLSDTLKCNSFPSHIIDRTFKRYLDGSFSQKSRNTNDDNNTRYFKLPFVCHYSKIAKLKLRQLTKRFCKSDLTIKLVFTSFKIQNMFSVKDRTPVALKSMVVYQFSCRHFSTRIKENTEGDKN